MTTLPWRHSRETRGQQDDEFEFSADEQSLEAVGANWPRRADCCVAQPAYRAVLPVTATRARSAQLLLCGHHYRSCREGLVRSGATVYDPQGHVVLASRAAR